MSRSIYLLLIFFYKSFSRVRKHTCTLSVFCVLLILHSNKMNHSLPRNFCFVRIHNQTKVLLHVKYNKHCSGNNISHSFTGSVNQGWWSDHGKYNIITLFNNSVVLFLLSLFIRIIYAVIPNVFFFFYWNQIIFFSWFYAE